MEIFMTENPFQDPFHFHSDDEEVSDARKVPSSSTNLHKFSHAWLGDLRFKDWLQEVEDDPYSYRCRFCTKNQEGPYSCRSGRIKVEQHSRTKIHTSRCIEAGIEIVDDLDAAVDLELPRSFQNQKTAM